MSEKIENWLKNNINWRVAIKVKEMKKWDVYMYEDSPNCFEYQGRKISIRLETEWVEVWDVLDASDYRYYVWLWDVFVCPEVRDAIKAVEREKNININYSDYITLEDIVKWVTWETIDLIKYVNDSHVKDLRVRESILKGLLDDIRNKAPFGYLPLMSNWKNYFRLVNESTKLELLNKWELVTRFAKEIIKYINENEEIIKEKVKKAEEEERQKEEAEKEQQKEQWKNLQSQL